MGTIPGFHPHEPGGIHKVLWSHIRDRRACVWVWERPCAAGRARGGFFGFPGFVQGCEGAGTPSPAVLSPSPVGHSALGGHRGALSRCPSSVPGSPATRSPTGRVFQKDPNP